MKKALLSLLIIFNLIPQCQSQTIPSEIKWNYVDITPRTFIFNKVITGYFIEENKDSERVTMNIFSDSTATNKIGSIKLSEILPTEIFDVLAYSYKDQLYLIKAKKDNKIYLIHEDVMYYQNWSKSNGLRLTKDYTEPKVLAKEKLLLDNYRLKLKKCIIYSCQTGSY